jgi:hypothetical protein
MKDWQNHVLQFHHKYNYYLWMSFLSTWNLTNFLRIHQQLLNLFIYLSVLYLTTLWVAQTLQRRMIRWLMINKLEWIWEEADVAWSKVLCRYLPEGTKHIAGSTINCHLEALAHHRLQARGLESKKQCDQPLFDVTWLHGYMVTWLHSYMVTWLHGYMVTWLHAVSRHEAKPTPASSHSHVVHWRIHLSGKVKWHILK